MDDLSEEHLALLVGVATRPGVKYPAPVWSERDSSALWIPLEEQGLIKSVGSFKWEPVDNDILLKALAAFLNVNINKKERT